MSVGQGEALRSRAVTVHSTRELAAQVLKVEDAIGYLATVVFRWPAK